MKQPPAAEIIPFAAKHSSRLAAVAPSVVCALFMMVAPESANAAFVSRNMISGLSSTATLSPANTRHVDVSERGKVYVVYNDVGGIHVAYGSGATFTRVTVTTASFPAEIAANAAGTFVTWVDTTTSKVMFSSSGSLPTFATAPVAIGNGSGSAHMAADAAYIYIVDSTGSQVYVSSDTGATFHTVALGAAKSNADIHVDPDNGHVIVEVDDGTTPAYYISTDHGATFTLQPTPAGATITGAAATALSTGSSRYLFVAGTGTQAMRIDTATGVANALTFSSATSERALFADRCGNVVDAYTDVTTANFAVSNDLGATFPVAYSGANLIGGVTQNTSGGSVAIDGRNGDIYFAYARNGQIQLELYSNELGNCYSPNSDASMDRFLTWEAGTSTPYTRPLTITNNTAAAVQVQNIAIKGEFSQTNDCGTSLAAGQSCIVNVKYSPLGVGRRYGQLQVLTDLMATPRIIPISGDAILGMVSYDKFVLEYGNQGVGTASTAQRVTVTNNSAASLPIGGFTLTTGTDYAIQSSNCGTALAANATCYADVVFTPTGTTTSGDTLTFRADTMGMGLSVVQSASLTGTGVPYTPGGSNGTGSAASGGTTTTTTSGSTGSTASGGSYADPELTSGSKTIGGGGAFGGFALGALALVAVRRRSAALAGVAMLAKPFGGYRITPNLSAGLGYTKARDL